MTRLLEKVDLPKGLKELGEDCFHDCKSLKQIKIPAQIETIGVSVFYVDHFIILNSNYLNKNYI